eukprot:TRINITY_DN11920_c0_g1_i1.p1 TRINITY_DN11920_c0_g1~~TRINITY_DN11920_c0_g1_i1.p1  ORF type:complete len:386 (+),score=28.98 TRINITY_DN11920_c0_g1_i1:87-1244(+)
MKAWREAASLILAAHKPRLSPPISHKSSTSATITDTDSIPEWNTVFDYQVLMLKRSSKSKFIPNAYVFPGGVSSSKDFSKGWLDLFSGHGFKSADLEALVLENKDRPFLLQKKTEETVDEFVSRDIAFRLNAIRETFEETGILLHHDPQNKGMSSAHNFGCDNQELEIIRKKVHADPSEMLTLYKDLDLLPDIWNLSEWSDWLTPVDLHEQGTRRFDTIFYFACLPELPQTILEKQEISAVAWTEPGTILNQFYRRELWLAPPQVYELCRLLNFEHLHQLRNFAADRQKEGCVNWLPVRLQCDDGLVSLLPGDSLYPDPPDYIGSSAEKKSLQVYKGDIKQCLQESEHLNRLTFKDTYHCIPKVNIAPAHGHVNPLQYHPFQDEE